MMLLTKDNYSNYRDAGKKLMLPNSRKEKLVSGIDADPKLLELESF